MIGFEFDGKHCSEFGIIMKSRDRALLSTLRKREMVIPGRHGAYDFEDNTYENKIISVDCAFVRNTIPDLRQAARRIAGWLKNKGQLRFDDEPDKYYVGQVYSSVPLETLLAFGRFTLSFECEPFAYSEVNSLETTITTQDPVFIFNNGTIETPEEITITNLGTNAIRGFKIKFIKTR